MLTIDAQDKTLGRVASAAAKALLGKRSADFAKNAVSQDGVTITNASKIRLSGNTKARDKKYVRYSGYPGGQKIESYAMLTARRGKSEAIRRAVLGMLPKNRLQKPRIKLLTITE
jgi:large subunit ribosomal protein L13